MDIKTELSIMESFTKKYKNTFDVEKSQRELICLLEMYPAQFIEPNYEDMYVGKKQDIPVYFGLNSRVDQNNYLGYVFDSTLMQVYYDEVQSKNFKNRLNELKEYWQVQKFDDVLSLNQTYELPKGITLKPYINYFNLDYGLLLRKGILGFRMYLESINTNDFIDSSLQCMYLLEIVIDHYIRILKAGDYLHKVEILDTLYHLKRFPPKTYHQASQLVYLYKQLSSITECNNINDHLTEYIGSNDPLEIRYIDEFDSLICKKSVSLKECSKIKLNVCLDANEIYNCIKPVKDLTTNVLLKNLEGYYIEFESVKNLIIDDLRKNYSFIYASILNDKCLTDKCSIIDEIPVEFVIENSLQFVNNLSVLITNNDNQKIDTVKKEVNKIFKI